MSAPVELPFTLQDRPIVIPPDVVLPPDVSLPETGDGANLVLWFALAAMSVIGMALMRGKKKEA